MPVEYVLVERGNPQDPAAAKKFYAMAKSHGSVTLRQLSREIADISTVSPIDTLAVLEALLLLIPKHIADGRIVRLGDFGSFSLTLSSGGADTEETFRHELIRSNHIRFRPGKADGSGGELQPAAGILPRGTA